MIKYEITITEIKKEKEMVKEYEKLFDAEAVVEGKDQYGYVQTEKEVETKKEIYSQTVDELDVQGVINAVNRKVVNMT